MRGLIYTLAAACWLVACLPADGATGRVLKVLPHFLDQQGRHTVSPSLYDRDAYQKFLRDNPDKRSGMSFDIQWKTKEAAFSPLVLRVELRGIAEGALPRTLVLEQPAEGGRRWRGAWTRMTLAETDYQRIGEITAWRVSLWEGERLLAEQTSFLW